MVTNNANVSSKKYFIFERTVFLLARIVYFTCKGSFFYSCEEKFFCKSVPKRSKPNNFFLIVAKNFFFHKCPKVVQANYFFILFIVSRKIFFIIAIYFFYIKVSQSSPSKLIFFHKACVYILVLVFS